MKRLGLVKPMVTAAGILALSGVAMAQREGDARGWMGGIGFHARDGRVVVMQLKRDSRGNSYMDLIRVLAGFGPTVRG